MGNDEAALLQLWREKRGEVDPEDLSRQPSRSAWGVTEDLNRRWYEAKLVRSLRTSNGIHPAIGAAVDGRDPGWPD